MKVLLISLVLSSLAYAEQDQVRNKMAELHKIKESIKSSVFERSRKEQEIQRIGIELSKQSEKIEELKTTTQNLSQSMQDRAVLLYKMKRASQTQSLFSIQKSQDFLKKTYLTQLFHKQDQKLSKQLTHLKSDLNKESAQFRKRLIYISSLRKNSDSEFLRLKEEEKKYRKVIQALKSESFDPVDYGSQFSGLRGQLPLPIERPYKIDFGFKRLKNSQLSFLNTGVYFETEGGESVVSPYEGQVAYIGELPHWGQTMILDHGDSYFTVYSNLTHLSVGLGDQINRQQKLAQVSNKKYDNKNGFYFEIRHYTEPQNPKEWFQEGVVQ